MIQFEDLDLIAVIKGKHYKIVMEEHFSGVFSCEDCAFYKLPLCIEYACTNSLHDFQYHYEEIPK